MAETQAEEKLERLFTDVMGPFRVESLSEFQFWIVFADQYTKFVFVDLRKAKSEALASLKEFVLSVGTPKKLRKDNAKEFLLVKDVLFKCKHSTGDHHTGEAATEWVRWEVQHEDGNILADWLRFSQDDVGSSNSPRNKDPEIVCETRRKIWCKVQNLSFQLVIYLFLVSQSSWGRRIETSAKFDPRH